MGSAPSWPLVLYFHHVSPEVHHYTSVTPDDFAYGMELVLEHFAPYEPADLLYPGGPRRPDRPTVLVTFDDGYRDNWTHARDLLRRFDVRAVFFAVTGRIGQRSSHPREDFLDRAECDGLAADGHLIGAHTRTHPHLDRLPAEQVQTEVGDSLADIRTWYGDGPARLFAYPYGGIPAAPPPLPAGTLAFATVRSSAQPWDTAPLAIRRTYLPSGARDSWRDLASCWRDQWEGRTDGE
ncbi:polysaccharide deacetylase family protein [Streptomyces sp. NPDC059496]|uniref:polysaccharide deacetylase family protein n=1 Tax=Streptomyces sp. NPDC059496 TaxID=3346851 RepID=UPI0036A19896